MRVADPKRWIALAAIGALVVGVLIWGFVGSIDSTVHADCVLIPRGGTYDVVTTDAGTINDVLVSRGDQLRAGQTVAVVDTVDGQTTEITTPAAGEVIEVLASPGDFVQVGAPLVNFQRDDEPLGVLMYVSPEVSGEVAPGQTVHISPDTASRQQFGFLEGHVQDVAPYPSTRAGMIALLNNDSLADDLIDASGGTPVEVWVAPDSAATPTGYHWSSSDGPPRLRAGTLCTADIVLAERRPIDLVTP